MEDASWESEPGQDETIEANWLFQLRRERFRSRRSGHRHDYFVVHLADSVTAVATTPDDQVILVQQFRAGSKLDHWETPGGLLLAGEDPALAGARELFEETGYQGDPARVLGTVWINPALLTTKMTTLLITNARKVGESTPDIGEEVVVGLFTRDQVRECVSGGQIDHALANLALLTWLSQANGLRSSRANSES